MNFFESLAVKVVLPAVVGRVKGGVTPDAIANILSELSQAIEAYVAKTDNKVDDAIAKFLVLPMLKPEIASQIIAAAIAVLLPKIAAYKGEYEMFTVAGLDLLEHAASQVKALPAA